MVSADLPESLESIEWIPVSAITTDHRVNTRPVDFAWVEKKTAEGFDPNKLGVPIVSRRTDGTYVWLDGQHRGELMRRSGWADQKIQCRVFAGLTLAQEAELFLGHNDNRQVKPLHKFLARVTAGDPDAVAITRIAENRGWKVQESGAANGISAVKALESVYLLDKDDLHPGALLQVTLTVVTEAWGYRNEAVDSRILQGVGALFNRFGDLIEKAALVKKLAEYPAGASGVIGNARGLKQFQGGTVVHCVAETIHGAYNARRRKNLLPDWR